MTAVSANLALIPLLPLLGSILAFVVGRKAHHLAGWIATGASALAFLWVVKLFSGLGPENYLEHNLYQWISVGGLNLDFLLRMDQLSAVMCLVVTGVGSLIHLYSVAYMGHDESVHRFFSYLNLFMFSMLLLVLGGNLVVLFVGWEGVGLCSYLLIGFWFTNSAYAAAGRKAFVVNRIGDAGFLLGMFLLFWNFGTLDFVELAGKIAAVASDPASVTLFGAVTLCLFIGAAGKSAQIPLFVWLPDAMAGPTPVSALIHAATMVTAGIYMLARMNFIYALSPETNAIVLVIALATALVAALTALTQNDIKKVLAYSTVSQLGFMFMAAACGAYWVAIFHVVTHAFFKACLFLGAGSVIHGCHHEQDMRQMGGLSRSMPITFATYLVATLAIAGIFPFAGYFSKHGIMNALAHNHNPVLHNMTPWIVGVATFAACLTAFYMTRSLALTFLGKYRGHAHPHESPWEMTAPLVVLAALSLVGGWWLSGTLGHYLAPVLPLEAEHHSESLIQSVVASWPGLLGVGLGLLLYTQLAEVPKTIYRLVPPLSTLFDRKFYFDELYGFLIVRPLEWIAKFLWTSFDQRGIDGVVNGSAALVDISGEVVRLTQTGQVRTYAFYMLLATVGVLALLVK